MKIAIHKIKPRIGIQTKLSIVFVILMTSISLLVSYIFYNRALAAQTGELGERLLSIAKTAALMVDGDEHSLLLTRDDEKSPIYKEIKVKLQALRDINKGVRYIYTTRLHSDNRLEFVLDSEEPIDENGNGIIEPEEDISHIGDIYQEEEEAYPEFIAAAQGTPTANLNFVTDRWGIWVSGAAPIRNKAGEIKGVLGVDISAQTVLAEQYALKVRSLRIIALGVIATLLISARVSRTITRPLLRLVEGTRVISQGDLNQRIEVKSNDEIGDLARAFNKMTEDLRKNITALRITNRNLDKKAFELLTLNKIGHVLNSTLDLNKVLTLTINAVVRVIKVRKGIILLAKREKENEFRVEITRGVKEENIRDIEFQANEKELSRIAREAKPILLKKSEERLTKNTVQEWLAKTGCQACAPLVVPPEVRGFLLLGERTSGEAFSKEDFEFLSTFVNQVSMAIENARLYHEAITDGLTGLFAHRYFQMCLDEEIKRAQRYKRPLSLLMLDIDHFKRFNDTYGHQQGDVILIEIAKLIKRNIRSVDIASRYGGEEMVVILPETDGEKALSIAQRMRKSIEEYNFPGGKKPLKVTVSLGVSTYPINGPISKEEFITRADKALYKAKENGRNRVCLQNSK